MLISISTSITKTFKKSEKNIFENIWGRAAVIQVTRIYKKNKNEKHTGNLFRNNLQLKGVC